MLKVDISKAFDSVRWEFIVLALRALHLPDVLISWIKECITTPTFSVCVNGKTEGYFKSNKGLRQGDPLSPYLFVLSMEVLSSLLRSRYDAGEVGYHPFSKKLHLSHLMFADDIMLFFDGKLRSLQGLSEALDVFGSWSGLMINASKSSLYIAGQSQEERLVLANHGYQLGELPIRYLGLPLMHRRLKICEYEVLIENLEKRFKSWATKALSFAGRIQLINSVINGVVNFWISTFMLPKGCIRRIESLCKRFLWAGNTELRKGAKVSWQRLCIPKEEGGVGLRSFSCWNKTLLLRFIWLLFSGKETIWSRWHKEIHLRRVNFWGAKVSPSNPWTWNELLKIRPLASRFLKCSIGDGKRASFWYDSWTPMGKLIERIGPTGPTLLGIPLGSSVAEACNARGWNLPPARSQEALELQSFLVYLDPPSTTRGRDVFRWEIDGSVGEGFSAAATWEALRPRDSKKAWFRMVWFKGYVPKLACNMWLAHLNRLQTGERLQSWGVIADGNCCICTSTLETRDHIFLTCYLAKEVWRKILDRLSPCIMTLQSWDDLFSWTVQGRSGSMSLLRKIVAHVAIFRIWKQRNNVLHNSNRITPTALFQLIDRDVKNTIHARRKKKGFGSLMLLWLR